MASPPTVSIVTVTFNSVSTLKDTMDSVLAQSYPNVEHLIIDGGSTDGTLRLIEENAQRYHGRLKWISEPDKGIYDAMNKGIALATGAVIGILNSDDLYADSSVLELVVESFETSRCDAVYGDLVFVDRDDTNRITRRWVAGTGRYLKGWNPPHPTLYVTRETYRRIGLYRPDYKISSDYDFMLRAFVGGNAQAHYLQRVMVKMRQGGASTSGLSSNRLAFSEAQRSLRELKVPWPTATNALRVLRKLRQFRSST